MKKCKDFYRKVIKHYSILKILRIMKLSAFLLFITVLHLFATGTYSQNTNLTFNLEETTVKQVLREIENQSEFYFLFNQKLVDVNRKVNLHVTEEKIEEILAQVFFGTNLDYVVLDRQIVISPHEYLAEAKAKLQPITASGTVTDENGEPLPGVTIVLKGTAKGSVSNSEGKYAIEVEDLSTAVLVFSFVGYTTQEISVNGRSVIDVAMKTSLEALDEVIVVGYGTMKKSDITGSVASVSAEELEALPVTRIDQALQGRSSGVVVQTTAASPNANVTIRIRGSNSISGNNDPLVVIDGFIGQDLSRINPNDVQSIEVLKDASATAIYGSRGANGVILVTTKRGAKGKVRVAYNNFFSIQSVRKKIDLMNGADYALMVNAHRPTIGLDPVFSESEINDLRSNGGTDWQDEIFRDAFWQNHQLSLSGGTESLSYYISGNIEDRDGILENTSYKNYAIRSNINADLSKKLKLGINLSMSKTDDDPAMIGQRGTADGQSGMYSVLLFAPALPVYDASGKYSMPAPDFGPPTAYNPVALVKEPIYDYYSYNIAANSNIEYEIIEGLKINIGGGFRLLDNENNSYINAKAMDSPGDEIARIIDRRSILLQNTNLISYYKDISGGHRINITGVFEQQYEEYSYNESGAQGFLTDAVKYNNLGLGNEAFIPSSDRSSKSIMSYMGRINYGFKERYLMTITGRYDGASVFGKDHKWGFFPSAALAWNIGNEAFMADVDKISGLKLRGSYGLTGSQALSPYASLASMRTDRTYSIDGTSLSSGVVLRTLENPDLRWEKTAQLNIGADLMMFNGRLEFTGDYYIKTTSDLLMKMPVPRTTGFSSVVKNIGEVENRGVELYLGGFPINNQFTWETGFNISVNKNKILKLIDDEPISLGSPGPIPGFGNTIWLEVGQPLGLFKGYATDGIWNSDEAEQAAVYGTIPGGTKYIDQDGNQEINSDDFTTIGIAQPDFTYGWNNNISFKNFDLNIFIQGVQGNDVYNIGRVRAETSSTDGDATSTVVLDQWTPQNQDTDVPSFDAFNYNELQQSDRWMEDGSYIRLKYLTLGYSLPQSVLGKIKISSARIYFTGTNLFTITDYTGYEPEATRSNDERLGVDLSTYPSQKIYTIGLNINF